MKRLDFSRLAEKATNYVVSFVKKKLVNSASRGLNRLGSFLNKFTHLTCGSFFLPTLSRNYFMVM